MEVKGTTVISHIKMKQKLFKKNVYLNNKFHDSLKHLNKNSKKRNKFKVVSNRNTPILILPHRYHSILISGIIKKDESYNSVKKNNLIRRIKYNTKFK